MTPERAKDLLDAEQRRMEDLRDKEEGRLAESLQSATGELSSLDQHPGEVGTEIHDREVNQSMQRSLEAELDEIEQARQRLAQGAYGRCMVCEEPIPDARLEVQPAARYCVVHQREAEQAEGAFEG